jgi:hypothetical protein
VNTYRAYVGVFDCFVKQVGRSLRAFDRDRMPAVLLLCTPVSQMVLVDSEVALGSCKPLKRIMEVSSLPQLRSKANDWESEKILHHVFHHWDRRREVTHLPILVAVKKSC